MAENTVPIFNGGNYDSWRIKMRAYLMSQGMWDLVENGYHHLKTEEAKEIQKKKDGEALLKILNVIPESIVPCFDNAKTSKEAWTILHQKYGGDEKLESIADVSNAKGLQKLYLRSCERLVDIPGIEQLKCLKTLWLSQCRRSLCDSILGRIMGLHGLESLLTDCCQITALPNSINSLENLVEIYVNNCKGLKFLPQLPPSLTTLSVCSGLKFLPQLPPSLTTLSVKHSNGLKFLPQLPPSLTTLSVNDCNGLKFLPQLPHSLTTLDASFCTELERIEGVSFSEGLSVLMLRSCTKLVHIPDIVQSKRVKLLLLGGCRSLEDSFLERVELFISHLVKDCLGFYSIPGRPINGGLTDSQSPSFLIPYWLMGSRSILLLGVDEKSLNRIGWEVDRKRPYRRQQGRSVVRLLFSTDNAQIPFSAFFEDGDPYGDLSLQDGTPTATVTVRRGELNSPSKMIKMIVSIDGWWILDSNVILMSLHYAIYLV